MPGFLVTAGASVFCVHGGSAQPLLAPPRVLLSGEPPAAQPIPHAVSGCSNPPPPNGVGPCLTATWATGTTRVRVLGMPLLTQDSVAVCVPTGTGLTVAATQARVRAM
jgi:hypothetical protein